MIRLFPLLMSVTMLAGCAHERRFTILAEKELTRCREVALEAAGSPEAWRRLSGRRLTSEPFRFDLTRIEYLIDFDTADRVGVMIPSGGRFGWHPCYLEVTVARKDFAVIKIEESCWP